MKKKLNEKELDFVIGGIQMSPEDIAKLKGISLDKDVVVGASEAQIAQVVGAPAESVKKALK